MKTKLPRRPFGLSRAQIARLIEALRGSRPGNPGISYLADQGFGMRVARSWYQTFQSLKERNLVEMPCRDDGSLLQAYKLTKSGDAMAKQILYVYPELGEAQS